jgi:hypothetical protein
MKPPIGNGNELRNQEEKKCHLNRLLSIIDVTLAGGLFLEQNLIIR